jgi:hypothetical protein
MRPLEERESVIFLPLQQACAHDPSKLLIEVQTIGTKLTLSRWSPPKGDSLSRICYRNDASQNSLVCLTKALLLHNKGKNCGKCNPVA